MTLTLPEETIRKLALIDSDRAKAIVAATEVAAKDETATSRVDLVEVRGDVALITVPYSEALERIPNVTLVQLAAQRFILVLEQGTSIADVEISLLDQLDTLSDEHERSIIGQVLEHIRANRRLKRVHWGDVILFSLD